MTDDRAGLLDGAIAPAQNDRLFGHQQAMDFLAQSYRSGKNHHAILIEGPEGIGKATLAFHFANHVLSFPDAASAPEQLHKPDLDSMVSRQIASGASHNLLHLTRPVDEKSGKQKTAITVDEVRRAGKFFSQTSGTGNWRIVIVDPADDLNRNAANAILKILEEPPKRAMFIVLSHAPGKLLPTIRSRCLSLRLDPLSDADMVSALANLDCTLPPERKELVLHGARGSVAEALKLLNYGGLEVLDLFRSLLSADTAPMRKEMHALADALSSKDHDVVFGLFVSQISLEVENFARQAAFAGDIAAADRFARLSSAIVERLSVSAAYNLDRKQTILTLLGEFREAVKGRG